MDELEEKFKHVDRGIREAVIILNSHGFKTWESCEGGEGHCFELPTVRFWGNEFDLIRAYQLCENYQLNIYQANRVFRKTEIATGDKSEKSVGMVWDTPFNELIFINHKETGTIFRPN